MTQTNSGQAAAVLGAEIVQTDSWPENKPLDESGSRGSRIWALASGKGGVGRSFLTASLACVLAQNDWPVTAVDLDFCGGDLHTLLGLPAESAGVGAFCQGRSGSLSELGTRGEVPGLSLIQGVGAESYSPNARSRARLKTALRRLHTPFTLLDLGSGGAANVLDFFVAADRPILVVLPEPAAVENAHRFIKKVYLRKLELLARARGVDRRTFEGHVRPSSDWRPTEVLRRFDDLRVGLGAELQHELEGFGLYLLMNQVRHVSDVGVGISLKNAVQTFFGISLRFVGAVSYDDEAWLSVRRRRLRVREATSELLYSQLETAVRNLHAECEIEPPETAAAML